MSATTLNFIISIILGIVKASAPEVVSKIEYLLDLIRKGEEPTPEELAKMENIIQSNDLAIQSLQPKQ